jgi:hypothetical protein
LCNWARPFVADGRRLKVGMAQYKHGREFRPKATGLSFRAERRE